MNIRKATARDIETLIRLRFDFFSEVYDCLTEEESAVIRAQLELYFPAHMDNDLIAVFAEENGEVRSTAFLVVFEKPATPSLPSGRSGTLINVYTYPEYRRRGLATMVIERIIEEADILGLGAIDLHATADGVPVYEKLGFTQSGSRYKNMKLLLL